MDQGVFDQAENAKSRIENAENLISYGFYTGNDKFKNSNKTYDIIETQQLLDKIEKLKNEKDFLNIQYEETTKNAMKLQVKLTK
ncbi:hypothetical protein SteCoe_38959 [Stentor coeruleus]|uniref:Uncharacterized protein n=1 Tax=Stentor coeruleus TaxID=5963 RepID=A0A1R2AL01_9CILI|nr:hypothetical protein SteCoe_38959 [Stentor coeruleus]